MRHAFTWIVALAVGIVAGAGCAAMPVEGDQVTCVLITQNPTLYRCQDGAVRCYVGYGGDVSCVITGR